jgi:hypothetical protein
VKSSSINDFFEIYVRWMTFIVESHSYQVDADLFSGVKMGTFENFVKVILKNKRWKKIPRGKNCILDSGTGTLTQQR